MTRVDCPSCERESTVCYRCEHCGHPLTDKQHAAREVNQ